MKINRIDLVNFRNFENASFYFPTNFTAVIGENGKGKSSILQALRVAAATFFLGIDEAERYHIQKEDLRRIDLGNRFVPQKNCSFVAFGEVNGVLLEWKRTLNTYAGRTEYKEASKLIEIAQSLNNAINVEMKEGIDLPVINFFTTARLWVDAKQTFKLKKKGSRLRDGYARCLANRSDKASPMEWIKSASWKKLKDKPESLLLDAVLNAIDTCVPNWKPIEWDEDSDDLGGIMTHEDGSTSFVPLYFLSDGLRTMAAMVAEIAYRCVVLNPHRGINAVKETKGIVLIDEIDMHLHPKWQQNVVGDLKKAFPNIQFIVTTHSPFVVQSLKAEELINLGNITEEDPNTLNLQDVASYVMNVKPRSLLFQEKFNATAKYFELLDAWNDDSNSHKEQLASLLDDIEKSSEVNDPAMAAFLKMNRLATLGKGEGNDVKSNN